MSRGNLFDPKIMVCIKVMMSSALVVDFSLYFPLQNMLEATDLPFVPLKTI